MRFVITLIFTLGLVFAPAPGYAEVAVYAKRTGGGENLYETEYARSGEWHITCSTQVAGSSVGRRWCSIEPLNDAQFTGDNFLDTAASGVSVKVWRDPVFDLPAGADDMVQSVEFIPTRTLAPRSEYSVVCGGYAVNAMTAANDYRTTPFSGMQARALLSAMTGAQTCVIDYFAADSVRKNEEINVDGLSVLLVYATRFTRAGVGHSY